MSISNFLYNDPVMRLTKKNMDLLVRRSELVAGNLANADTPGFKARDIDFQDILEKAASGAASSRKPTIMTRTNPKHLPVVHYSTAEEVNIIEKDGANLQLDQNTVNMEEEMRKANEIALLFDFASSTIKRKGNLIASAIKGT